MFVQIIQGKVKDADLLDRQIERWTTEIKPGVKGYLGSTHGVTPDGRGISIVRFDSPDAARANSTSEQQTAWWNETAKAFDGEPTFHDAADVDTVVGGGSDQAGFVQVIQGRAKDASAMRSRMREMESELTTARPDILGMTLAWHGDGGFTQAVYFRSEAETRTQEKATENDDMRRQYMDMFDGPPTFFDLTAPHFD